MADTRQYKQSKIDEMIEEVATQRLHDMHVYVMYYLWSLQHVLLQYACNPHIDLKINLVDRYNAIFI